MKIKSLLFLLCLTTGLQAQVFKGVIKFASDSSVAPFANVYIKGTTKGTVSNTEGAFALRYKNPKDTVILSYAGTKRIALPLSKAVKQGVFYLIDDNQLNEVLYKAVHSARGLLEKAVENLAKNYPTTPTLIDGYLKENAWQNDTLSRMIETAVRIWNPGYLQDALSGDAQNALKLLNVRRMIDLTSPFRPLGHFNTVTEGLFIDRNLRFITAHWDDYDYALSDKIRVEGRDAYTIDFKAKKALPSVDAPGNLSYYQGSAVIAIQDYALVKLTYEERYVDLKAKGKLKGQRGRIIPYTTRFRSSTNSLRYKPFGDRWYLNFVRKAYSLYNEVYPTYSQQGRRSKHVVFHYRIADTFMATDIQNRGVLPLMPYERVNLSKPIYEQLSTDSNTVWSSVNPLRYTEEETRFLRERSSLSP